jgi:hypothetical protein
MKKIRVSLSIISLWLLIPSLVFAEEVSTNLTTNIGAQVDGDFFQTNLGVFITNIVEFALIIGAIATLFYLIIGAVMWITSGGESSKLESARGHITNAVIGLGVLASVWTIWALLLFFFGIKGDDRITLPQLSSQTSSQQSGTPARGDWWPFRDQAHWEEEFIKTHGRSPEPKDTNDFRASQEFMRKCNLTTVSNEAWIYYTENGKFPACP